MNWRESATSIISLLMAENALICGFPRCKNWREPTESKCMNCWPQKCQVPTFQGVFPQNAREGPRLRGNENSPANCGATPISSANVIWHATAAPKPIKPVCPLKKL